MTAKKPASTAVLPENLDILAKWLEKSGLDEVEIETEGTRIRLRKSASGSGITFASPMQPAAVPAPSSSSPAATPENTTHQFKSPMVGTFYRSSGPESQPFVNEGDSVKEGQTLCIIEAMKTMNTIVSDRAGIIKKIMVKNAQPVEFAQPLFFIE